MQLDTGYWIFNRRVYCEFSIYLSPSNGRGQQLRFAPREGPIFFKIWMVHNQTHSMLQAAIDFKRIMFKEFQQAGQRVVLTVLSALWQACNS